MFNEQLSKFSQTDSDCYLRAIISVAMADKKIHEKEKDFINMQAQLLSINPEPYWESKENDLSFLDNIELSKLCRMAIIRDSIVLANIDAEFDDSERKKIHKIAEKLQINKSDVDNIENWLKELWSVIEKGNKLFA